MSLLRRLDFSGGEGGGTRLTPAAPDQALPEANRGACVSMNGFDEDDLPENTPGG